MMTRKDYIKTADILWAYRFTMNEDAYRSLVSDFAEMMAVDNPRFDRARFFQACSAVES